MKRKKLYWQIYTSFVFFFFICLLFAGQYLYWKLFVPMLVGLVAPLVLAYYLSRKLGAPLETIAQDAQIFSQGKFNHKIYIKESAPAELQLLAKSLNGMAKNLGEMIQGLNERNHEMDSVLRNMVEAVVSIDLDRKIILLNPAAQTLFQVQTMSYQGKFLEEVIRFPQIHDLFNRILELKTPMVSSLSLTPINPQQRLIQLKAQGAAMTNSQGEEIGALIVFHDTTKIHQLESYRKDFVANVSHELRTPLTTIKGLSEIIMDGPVSQDQLQGFMEKIVKNVDRLNALVEDLLTLAQLDRENIIRELKFESLLVRDLFTHALQVCELKLQRKSIQVKVFCPENLKLKAENSLIEMALINLIDNAIKYGNTPGEIHLRAEDLGKEIVLSVANNGPLIAKEYQERVFERFFRLDKSRSFGSETSTGLGLSIVKHVAMVHQGRAGASDDRVLQGPVFWISLPSS